MGVADRRTEAITHLRRRDFLALGSLGALATWAPYLTFGGREARAEALAEPAAAAAAAAEQPLPLSLGYLEGSEELQNLRKLPPDLRTLVVNRRGQTFVADRRILPSTDYPAGDPSLVGGALRMTVHDLYPSRLPDDPEVAALWPTAVDLDVQVPLMEDPPGRTALYEAWSYRRLPAEDRSARVSFLLWPDWTSALAVSLRVVPAAGAAGTAPAPPRLLTASFTLGDDRGRPRMLKGVYLLGLAPGAWDQRVDLPDDPTQVPPELLSVMVTLEPEGVRVGGPRS
jgi:hypothetical protein